MVDYEIIHECMSKLYFCLNCGGYHYDCPYKNIFRLKYTNEEYNELLNNPRNQMRLHEKMRRDLDVDLAILVRYKDLFKTLFFVYAAAGDRLCDHVLHELIHKKLNIISIQNFINMGKYLEDHSEEDLIDNVEDAVNYRKLIMIKPARSIKN